MKHIAFLTLSMSKGGAERVIANMCNEYLVHHYQVTIITCMNRPLEYDLDKKIKVVTVDNNAEDAKQNMAARFLRRRSRLRKVLGEVSPDVLLCFLPEPNMLACSLKRPWSLRNSLRFPVIISVRNDPVREYKSKTRQLMMRALYPKADGYVFQTEDAKNYFNFSKHIMDRACVIPNPLSRAFLDVEQPKQRVKKVISVGSLSKQKNQRMLIDAFAKIHDKYPDYVMEICGEGSLRKELQTYINENGLSRRISLTGQVDEIAEQIYDSSLFVMSSDYEGMPNALIEAMALGLPCISTDCPCGGPRYLIEDGVNGRLVPVADVTKLSEVMDEMLSNPEKAEQMGLQARKIQDKLHPDVINAAWDAYINKYL